jgi:MFS family permease
MQTENGFYGWRPLSGAILTFLVGSGIFFYSYGVFLPFMSTEFGWGRAATGGALSVTLLAFGLPSPLIGASISRFGPRLNIILGNSLVGLGLVSMSFATEVWQLYVFFGILVGVGTGFGMYIPCTTVVNNWFVKRQSLAMALLLSAGGMGGFVFPPLVTWLLSSVGWQGTWLTLAAVHFTFTVIVGGLILVRNRPEDTQQDPHGIRSVETVEPEDSEGRASSTRNDAADWQMRDMMRSPVVWLIATIYMTSFFAISTLAAHQVAYLRDLGHSPMTAAFTLSIMTGSILLGRLAFGALGSRYDMRRLVVAFYCIQLTALSILLTAPGLSLIYAYAVLFGLSYGGLGVAAPTLIGAYFGGERFVKVLSIVFPLAIAVEALGPIVAGAIHDLTDTYVAAFAVVAIFCAAGLAYSIAVRNR